MIRCLSPLSLFAVSFPSLTTSLELDSRRVRLTDSLAGCYGEAGQDHQRNDSSHYHPPHHQISSHHHHQQQQAAKGLIISNINLKTANLEGTWQAVPKNEASVDRPALRDDTTGLALAFELAMMTVKESTHKQSNVDNIIGTTKRPSASGACASDTLKRMMMDSGLWSSLQSDLFTIKSRIENAFEERQVLHELFASQQEKHDAITSLRYVNNWIDAWPIIV